MLQRVAWCGTTPHTWCQKCDYKGNTWQGEEEAGFFSYSREKTQFSPFSNPVIPKLFFLKVPSANILFRNFTSIFLSETDVLTSFTK